MQPILPLLCAATLLAACGTPYHPARIVEAGARFPGLIDVLAAQPQRQLDVLLVHGICTHDATWAARTVAQLDAALQANVPADATLKRATPLPDGRIAILPATLATAEGTLHIKSLVWSPLTQPLKRQLCDDETDKSAICQGTPPYTPTRAHLNALLKDVLLDDCLSDAVIYGGVARDAIELRMRDALMAAAADATPSAPLFVIAESLGSSILFDTLNRMLDEAPASPAARSARQIVMRLRYLEMAANPIPLMALAAQDLPAAASGPVASSETPSAAPATAQPISPSISPLISPSISPLLSPSIAPPVRGSDSLQRLLQRRRQLMSREAAAPLLLIAYSDPNDALTYTLPPARYANDDVTVVNVLVSNATTYLGLLERPDLAHMDYLNNPDVGRLIACGQPASPHCK